MLSRETLRKHKDLESRTHHIEFERNPDIKVEGRLSPVVCISTAL